MYSVDRDKTHVHVYIPFIKTSDYNVQKKLLPLKVCPLFRAVHTSLLTGTQMASLSLSRLVIRRLTM